MKITTTLAGALLLMGTTLSSATVQQSAIRDCVCVSPIDCPCDESPLKDLHVIQVDPLVRVAEVKTATIIEMLGCEVEVEVKLKCEKEKS